MKADKQQAVGLAWQAIEMQGIWVIIVVGGGGICVCTVAGPEQQASADSLTGASLLNIACPTVSPKIQHAQQ